MPEAPTNPAPESNANQAPAQQPTVPVQQPAEVDTDQQEWDHATDEMFPGIRPVEKKAKEPEVKPEEKKAEEPKDAKSPEDPTDKPEDKKTEELEAQDQQPQLDMASINMRLAQRQSAEVAETIRSDVRSKLYPDPVLKDADGDVINGIQDLMRLVDPRTGEPFTEEAATVYWSQAQQQLQSQREETNKKIEQVTTANLNLKDEADVINAQAGAFLKAHPDLQKSLWEQYSKTLKIDPTTGIILETPISLLEFYTFHLRPYAERYVADANAAKKQEDEKKAQQEAEAARKAEEEKKRQSRSDRSDIYGSGKTDTMDEDEKEWNDAAKSYYGF